MTSPAMPRNEAALRYSPLIAAALAVGRTARAATRKSDVVCAKRRANTPTATVATSIARSPSTAGTEVMAISWLEQLGELVVDRLGVPDVVQAQGDHQRVRADAQHQPGQRDREHADQAVRGPQPRHHRLDAQRQHQGRGDAQAQHELPAHQRPEEDLADRRLLLELPELPELARGDRLLER